MNRREQNKGLKDWEDFSKSFQSLESLIRAVLIRGTHESGYRQEIKLKDGDPEAGSPSLRYADPTGETATRRLLGDKVEANIKAMVNHLSMAANLAKSVLDITPPDVVERAKQEVPDCAACGQPCLPRRISNYCPACYNRWTYLGRPDRPRFEREMSNNSNNSNSDDWRVEMIDTLQERGDLPKQKESIP